MKKIFKKSNIFSFLLGAIIFGGIVGVSAYTILANDIGYTPKDSTWKKSNGEDITNVKDAIDELYIKAQVQTLGCEFVGSYQSNKIKNADSGTLTISDIPAGTYKLVVVRTSSSGATENGGDTIINSAVDFTITTDGSANLISGKSIYEVSLNDNSNIIINASSVGTSTTWSGHIYAFLFR